jgi:hypothetical protein
VTASVVNHDSAHGLGGDRVKVASISPLDSGLIYETEICLVHQTSGAQGVPGPLMTKGRLRDPVKVVIYDGEELIHSRLITDAHLKEEVGNGLSVGRQSPLV